MHKESLGKVLPGPETVPSEQEDVAPRATTHTRYDRLKIGCDEKNDSLFTRFLMATVDSPEGFSSIAAHVIQGFAPIGAGGFGNGHGAVKAREVKYRLDDVSRM